MFNTLRSFFEPPISADPAQSNTKLAWLVRLRWLALMAQLLAIIPAIEYRVLEPHLVVYFGSVIALLALLNSLTWLALRRGVRGSPMHLLLQLCADIIGLSFLLILTGGAWQPMVPILFVHSVLGALLLEGRFGLLFFLLLIACLVVIQTNGHIPPGLDGALLPPAVLFPAQILVALVFWILTAWLARTLERVESQIAHIREQKTRIDRLRAVGALVDVHKLMACLLLVLLVMYVAGTWGVGL